MASPLKIYWDSCAWLGLINGEAGRKRDLEMVYGQAKHGHIELWTSTIAVVEVYRLDTETNIPKPLAPDTLAVIDDILFQPFVKLVGMDTIVAKRARKIIRETPKLSKKSDAMHLATAIIWNIPIFHTYDGNDLLHLNGKVTCIDGSPIEICLPYDPNEGGLLAHANKDPA